jgi:hypothetical protein
VRKIQRLLRATCQCKSPYGAKCWRCLGLMHEGYDPKEDGDGEDLRVQPR